MKPWKHQQEAVPRLLEGNYILAWEPGVGKTLPLLQAASQRGGRCLYLGPPAIRTQVAKEAVAFGCFAQKDVQVVATGKDLIAPQAKLVICSYEHAVTPAIWKQLFALKWESMVLDEGHMLKNSAAKRTRAVYGATAKSAGALYKRADRVWVATGTPLVNDPSDLWPHLSRLMPTAMMLAGFTRKQDFQERYCHIRKTPYGPVVTGGKNLPELRALLAPLISRVRKEDVHDLPPLQLTEAWVPAADLDLTDVPEEALIELREMLKKGDDSKLERFAPALATLRRRIGLAKAAHSAELVQSELHSGINKVIVFYQHRDVGDLIVERLAASQLLGKGGVAQYSGGMTQEKRDAVVKQFTGDSKCRVLVAQIQAAGTGLNLQCAERVLIVEPAWTPALNEQAIARVYRAGQTKKVWASYVCLADSVDESITQTLLRKGRIIKGALG